MNIKLTFFEEVLGTKSANKQIFLDWIASKHPSGVIQKDEAESIKEMEDGGTSIFSRLPDGKPMIFDYQIKGFFKDACAALNRCDQSVRDELGAVHGVKKGVEKLAAFKSKIDGCVFIEPRMIELQLPEGADLGWCERPLRIEGPQGTRVCLARSETAPVGTVLEFEVSVLASDLNSHVLTWLAYGRYRGLAQWRNSGKGRFTVEVG